VENEALYLTKKGHQVYVLSYRFNKRQLKKETYKGIIIYRLLINKNFVRKFRPLIGYSFDIYSSYWEDRIISFLKMYKVDVLHVHDLYMAPAAINIKQKMNLPIVLDLHENFPAAIQSYNWTKGLLRKFIIRPKRWLNLEKKIIENIDKLIVLSESYKRKLCHRYSFLNSKDVIVYPNVPNIEEFESYPVDKNILTKGEKKILFYFGVVAERRGIYLCIEALKILQKKFPFLTLLIIGPVDKIETKRFWNAIQNEGVKDSVTYFPWKDISLLPSYIYNSDICLSPLLKNEQHDSGIANKVFQYMLFGKPIITSNCEPQKQLIEEANCGVTFKSNDVKDLASNISYLLENPDIAESLGKNGKKAVLTKYNWAFMGQNLLSAYDFSLKNQKSKVKT
jgi:glycosyltransferase involved in cell wall biosynthesis